MAVNTGRNPEQYWPYALWSSHGSQPPFEPYINQYRQTVPTTTYQDFGNVMPFNLDMTYMPHTVGTSYMFSQGQEAAQQSQPLHSLNTSMCRTVPSGSGAVNDTAWATAVPFSYGPTSLGRFNNEPDLQAWDCRCAQSMSNDDGTSPSMSLYADNATNMAQSIEPSRYYTYSSGEQCSWPNLPRYYANDELYLSPDMQSSHARMPPNLSQLNQFLPQEMIGPAAPQQRGTFQVGYQQGLHVVPQLLYKSCVTPDETQASSSTSAMASQSHVDTNVGNDASMPVSIPVLRSQKRARSEHRPETTSSCHKRRRMNEDKFLLEARDSGMTYREIKRAGGFKEAESTLRGRIRMLSKPAHERVRKPRWYSRDIVLLRTAVATVDSAREQSSSASPPARRRRNPSKSTKHPPWKKIATWMRDNGSSYPFAAATCAKKWEEISSGE